MLLQIHIILLHKLHIVKTAKKVVKFTKFLFKYALRYAIITVYNKIEGNMWR